MRHENAEGNLQCAGSLTNQYKMLCEVDNVEFFKLPRLSQYLHPGKVQDQGVYIHQFPTMEKGHRSRGSSVEKFMDSIEKDCKTNLARYLSTGNLNELKFRKEYIHQYLFIADKLGLSEMKSYCEEQLESELIPHDSVEMLQIARAYNMKQLQKLCLRLIEIHFPELWQTAEFQYLGKNDLISLIQNPVISSLSCAVDAVKQWYMYEPELRHEGYETMLKMLKVSNANVQNGNQSKSTVNGMEYIIMYSADKNGPDVPMASVMCLETGKIEQVKLSKLGHCGNGFSVCCQQKDVKEAPYIYVSGGKEKSSARVFKCDVIMKKWKELGHLKYGRSHHCMVNLEDKLYVLGGFNHHEGRNEPRIEECKDGKHFKTVGNLCEVVRSSASVAYDNKIYIFGGVLDNSESSSSIQMFDPSSGKSRIIGNLPFKIDGGSAIVINEQICIISKNNKMLLFDPKSLHTKQCAELPHPVCEFCLFCHDCNIYVACECDEMGNSNKSMFRYSIFDDKWEESSLVLPSDMSICGCSKIRMQRDLAMFPLLD